GRVAGGSVGTNPLGGALETRQRMADVASPDYELESLVNEDIRVRLFGDVAVATARGTAKGKYKGQDASGQFRYTRIWVKREGRWQAGAGQAAMIPQEPANQARRAQAAAMGRSAR